MKNKIKHLTPDLLSAFHQNSLSEEDYVRVLEHICNCTHCADLFANSFDRQKQLIIPKHLKESILLKAVFETPVSRKQLFYYNLRVCTAICGALLLLFSFCFSQNKQITEAHSAPKFHITLVNSINTNMKDFSDEISKQMSSFVSMQKHSNLSNFKEDIYNDN